MNFASEKQMSETFKLYLEGLLVEENCFFQEEIKGITGIPDYVLYEENGNQINYIVSFELKLKNWKQALKQAFRYRNFSNDSIVILDEDVIQLALNNMDFFKKYNIGLGSFNKNKELKIYYYPSPSKPFSNFYIEKIVQKISKVGVDPVYHSSEESILNKKLFELCY